MSRPPDRCPALAWSGGRSTLLLTWEYLMTLNELAAVAGDREDDPITLAPEEARDIVTAAADADERCRALALRNEELTNALAERDATIARLRNEAEDNRLKLAAALQLIPASVGAGS